jgi:hypothetical protein
MGLGNANQVVEKREERGVCCMSVDSYLPGCASITCLADVTRHPGKPVEKLENCLQKRVSCMLPLSWLDVFWFARGDPY